VPFLLVNVSVKTDPCKIIEKEKTNSISNLAMQLAPELCRMGKILHREETYMISVL